MKTEKHWGAGVRAGIFITENEAGEVRVETTGDRYRIMLLMLDAYHRTLTNTIVLALDAARGGASDES